MLEYLVITDKYVRSIQVVAFEVKGIKTWEDEVRVKND